MPMETKLPSSSTICLPTHDLAGALWDPDDGDIDPAQLTQALAKGARDMGARIERFCPDLWAEHPLERYSGAAQTSVTWYLREVFGS